MEIYKQKEYDVRNIIDDISGLSGLFENYVEEVNEFIDYLLEDTKEINTLKQELQRKDNIINELKEYLEYEIEEWKDVENEWGKIRATEDENILDKMKELENGKQ